MSSTLIDLFVTSLFIFGLYAATRADKALGFISKLVVVNGENRFALANVICECPVCMSSLYGTAAYLYFNGLAVSYHYSLTLLSIALVLWSACEIGVCHRRRKIKDVDKLEFLQDCALQLSTTSTFMYLCTLTAFLVSNQYYECLIFVMCLSGLNFIIEGLLIGLLSLVKINKSIESSTAKMVECTQAIIDKK